MSLVKSLFELVSERENISIFRIDKTHDIFNGHFPNQPVLPAVTMLQLLKFEVERQTKKTLQLERLANAKFLQVVNPQLNDIISIELKITSAENKYKVNAILKQDSVIVAKLSTVYSENR